MPIPKIAVVGAGAAGVFTAYRLREMYGDLYEVVLVEERDRVGGNCYSTQVEYGGKAYNIDCGAQFFYKNPQPSYCALIEKLGLMDSSKDIIDAPAGFTVYDKPANEFRLWLPSRVIEFLGYGAADWERLIKFLEYMAYAAFLDREAQPNWQLSVDDWFAKLTLLDADFKEKVLKPFLYQFVSLPLERIGESSALYAVTYFIRNLLGDPGVPAPNVDPPALPVIPTFTTYQSMIGLDGIHKKALEAANVIPHLSTPILKAARVGNLIELTTPDGIIKADHVVFATDPQRAASILEAGGTTNPELIDTLKGFEYAELPISMQKDGSCWMPPNGAHWEPVNTLVDGDQVRFTAWFGPLRPSYEFVKQIPVFKSWGSPDVGGCPNEFLAHRHFIPLPTTTFMKYRDALQGFQGKNGIWFAGGWTTWFDSQEAALESATKVADGIPGEPAPATGLKRLVPQDPERIERSLRQLLERVARVAPAEHKARITQVIERVASQG